MTTREKRPPFRLALGAAACILGSTAPPMAAQEAGPPVIRLSGAENLTPGVPLSKAATRKVSADLWDLHAEYRSYLNRMGGSEGRAFRSKNTLARISGDAVVIDTAAAGDPETLAADLRALGADHVAVFGRVVSARLPIMAIPALDQLSSLHLARPAYAMTQRK